VAGAGHGDGFKGDEVCGREGIRRVRGELVGRGIFGGEKQDERDEGIGR
jgi:hypothetical protein